MCRLLHWPYLIVALGLALLAGGSRADVIWDADVLVRNGLSSTTLTVGRSAVAVVRNEQIRLLTEARDRLGAKAGVFAKVLLTDRPVANAWAISTNGQKTVAVSLQMLNLLGDDVQAYAALMGHELAHLERGHGSSAAMRNVLLQILGALAGVALESKIQTKWGVGGIGSDIADMGTGLFVAAYSRDDEREADSLGTQWMMQAGYDPQGAIRLHETLARLKNGDDSFFATHPSSSERIANIRKLIAQQEASALKLSPYVEPPPQVWRALPPMGQVGVVVALNKRHGYPIFSGTTAIVMHEGMIVRFVSSGETRATGRITRAVDGYYSAFIYGDINSISVGDSVEFGPKTP